MKKIYIYNNMGILLQTQKIKAGSDLTAIVELLYRCVYEKNQIPANVTIICENCHTHLENPTLLQPVFFVKNMDEDGLLKIINCVKPEVIKMAIDCIHYTVRAVKEHNENYSEKRSLLYLELIEKCGRTLTRELTGM